MKEKIYYLESLRGLAAITVCLFHFRFSSSIFLINNTFIQNGWIMVDFFFVLSGFVISYGYKDKLINLNNLFSFQFNRFIRLYPLHLITLLLFLNLEFLQFAKEYFTGVIGEGAAFTNNNFKNFFLNFFLVQALFNNDLTFNNPSWSISTEFFTYLLYGLIIIFFKKTYSSILIFLCIVILTSLILKGEIQYSNQLSIFRCMFSFFLGCIVCYSRDIIKISINSFFVYLSFLISIYLILNLINIQNLFLPISFSLLIFSLISSDKDLLIKKLLNNNILIFIGKISYGIYMIHYFVWITIEQITVLIGIGDPSKKYLYEPILGIIILLIGLFTIIFLSYLSYEFFEKKIMKYRKRF